MADSPDINPGPPPEVEPIKEQLLADMGGYSSVQDIIGHAETSLMRGSRNARDPFAAGKATPYPSATLGYDQFYPKTAFKRLGFNPYENNFENYKDNTTNWELFLDAQKAHFQMHNSMFSFFGAKAGPDPGSYEAAAQYEDLVALGTPLGRDDTYSWALKQYVQSGYTAAIVSSIMAEEVALVAATMATEGATAELAWARTAQNFKRLGSVADKTGDLYNLKKAYDLGSQAKKASSTLRGIKDLQSVQKARAFWNTAKQTGTKAVGSMFPHATAYAKSIKDGTYALNGFAAATNGFAAFWREMREFNLAFDEADLEKAFVEKETMHQLIGEYRKEHDDALPDADALAKIQKIASEAGRSTQMVNAGLIYMTNKIGFGSLFNKFSPKIFSETLRQSKFGKTRIHKADLKMGKKASMEYVRAGYKNQFKDLTKKSSLKQSPLRGAKYLSGASAMATTEGVQEYLQEVIQDAETRFAKDKYTKALDGNWLDYYGNSMKKYISAEGGEVFLSGFAMGAFAGPHRFMTTKIADAAHAGTEMLSGNYKRNKEAKQETQESYERQVEHINEIFSKPWSRTTGLGGLMDYRSQDQRVADQNQAVEDNDEKTFRDIKDDSTFEVLYKAMDNDVLDTLIDQVEQMDSLDDEETMALFKEYIGTDATKEDLIAFQKDSGQIADRARYIRDLRERTEKDYINPFHVSTGEQDDTTFGYDVNFMHRAYEYAKKQVVKNHYSYKRSLERKAAIMEDFTANPPFWDKGKTGSATDYTILLNAHDLNQEINIIQKELKGLKEIPSNEITPNQTRDRREKTNQLDKLQNIEMLLRTLDHAYKADAVNAMDLGKFKADVKSGAKEAPPVDVGAKVVLSTKAGGKGEITGERGNQWFIKKEKWSGWVHKDRVSLDVDQVTAPNITDSVVGELGKSFKEYMDFLAKKNDNTLDEKAVNSAFQKLLDFYALNQDGKNLTQYLNMLSNPQGFENTLLRKAEAEKKIWENKKEIIAQSLEQAVKSRQDNFLMQTLKNQYNALIIEEDAQNLFENEIIPATFYDADSNKPIDDTSKRHSEIKEEVQEYLDSKWERTRAAREEYKQGDEIYPEDIVDNKDVSDKIKAQVKENIKSTLIRINETNEDGTLIADLKVGDEILTATLRAPAKPETVVDETETAPVAAEEAVPGIIPGITSETPIEEMGEEVLSQLREAHRRYNETIAARGDLSETVRQRMHSPDIEHFLTTPAGKRDLRKITGQDKVEKKAKQVFAKPTPVSDEVDPEETFEEGTTDDTGVIGTSFDIAEAKVELPEEIRQKVLAGEATAISLGLRDDGNTDAIVKALRTQGIIGMNETLKDKGGKSITVTVDTIDNAGQNIEMLLVFEGRQGITDTALETMINRLGLPSVATDLYKHPVQLGETTYYTSSEDQKAWLEGSGKQNVFAVGYRLAPQDLSTGFEGFSSWVKSVNERFKEASSPEDVAAVLAKVSRENQKRELEQEPFLDVAQLQTKHDEALESLAQSKSPTQFKVGEQYEMKGGFTNLVGTVESVSPQGVGFELSNGETVFIKTEGLAEHIHKQTTDIEETIAEQSVEVTPEQEETSEENQAINNEITAEDIEAEVNKNQGKSPEQVAKDFFASAKQDEDNCK